MAQFKRETHSIRSFSRRTRHPSTTRESQADRYGCDVLTANNRGSDRAVAFERFGDCVADIDAALAVGRRLGYRGFVLLGHSTGGQKITLYQSCRQNPAGVALALAAPADDFAIARRDLGQRYNYWLKHARKLVEQGQGKTLLPMLYEKFSARRFLSIADPRSVEAQLFNYAGALHHFSRIRCPVLAFLGTREEYACMPVVKMGEVLRAKTRSQNFHFTNAKMTRVRDAVRAGNGIIGASFREIPAVAIDDARDLIRRMERQGLGGILAIGQPNQPLLNIPVTEGRTGMIVAGGLNPIAALCEAGAQVTIQSLAGLEAFDSFLPFETVWDRFPNLWP